MQNQELWELSGAMCRMQDKAEQYSFMYNQDLDIYGWPSVQCSYDEAAIKAISECVSCYTGFTLDIVQQGTHGKYQEINVMYHDEKIGLPAKVKQ